MKRIFILIGGLLILVLLAGCGPSPEQIATMTASAWTQTPVPPTQTPTPTPVPIDLTVTVTDETGAPIAGASIVFPESGDDAAVQTNKQGQYSWSNLPGELASLNISAQGYIPNSANQVLVRGTNNASVALQRDPFGLLPSEACASGEKLLYAEDFQDNRAQGWNEIDLKTPGWDMAASAEKAGDIILSAQYSEMLGDGPLSSRLNEMEFENAVWRVNFLISQTFARQQNWFSFNWKHALNPFDLGGQQIFDSRYQTPIGFNYFALRRVQQPVTNIGIGQVKNPKADEWHLVEISSHEGLTGVWLDGKRLLEYEDPQPIPPGTIGFELWLSGSETIVYFDDMSVCELSTPFISIVPVEP